MLRPKIPATRPELVLLVRTLALALALVLVLESVKWLVGMRC